MSGLDGWFGRTVGPPLSPGSIAWHGHFPVEDVRHTVEHAGWRFAAGRRLARRHQGRVPRAVGEALAFPDHYGQNFDALADCLGDITAGDSEGWVLLWDGWGPLAREDQRAFYGRPSRSSAAGSTPTRAARSRSCSAATDPTSPAVPVALD